MRELDKKAENTTDVWGDKGCDCVMEPNPCVLCDRHAPFVSSLPLNTKLAFDPLKFGREPPPELP